MSTLASQSPVKEKIKKTKEREETEETKGKVEKVEPFSPPSLYLRLIIGGVLGIAMVGGIFFSASQLKLGVEEIEKKRGQMVALQEKEENLMMLSLIFSSVEGEIPLIEKAFPNQEEVIDFIKKVEELGREVSLENFNFESDRPQSDPEENSYLEWTIEASGPLPKLEEFLANLLSLPVLIRPKVIDIDEVDREVGKLVFRGWLYVEPDFFEERNTH